MKECRRGLAPWLAVGLFCAALSGAFASGPAEDGYRKLKAADIRKTFIGKVFTDGAHFSERFKADGTIEGYAMGKKATRAWKILDDELCITGSSEETCYGVWKKGSEIQLIFKDSDTSVYGTIE
jgi:hypothetical protein